MLPCSSIYQHFPLTNQTWRINDHDHNNTTFEIDDQDHNITFEIDDHNQNPIMISSEHDHQHHHHHHRNQQHSSPHSHNFIPSIFEDDGVMLSHLLSQQQLLCCNNISTTYSQPLADEISVVASNQLPSVVPDHDDHHNHHKAAKGQCSSSSKKAQRAKQPAVPRKRTAGKKDRHSKICTAQGLRDRRMRLSLQIARKFFDLQDMLGFDKASRTIEWLFTKSRTAIKELKDSLVLPNNKEKYLSSSNSTSEGEVASSALVKIGAENDDEEYMPIEGGGGGKLSMISLPKDMKRMRKLHKVVARESRDKARARARERTREKMLENSRPSGGSNTTIYEAEKHSYALELEGDDQEEMACHYDLKMAAPRFDRSEPTDQFQLDYSLTSQDGHVVSGANSEEDFLGFPQNWDIINCSSKTQPFCPKNMGNNVVMRVQNPYAHFCSTQLEQKPSSMKVPTSSSNAQQAVQNPSLVFMSTTASNSRNPSSVLMATSTLGDAEEQNPNPIFTMTDSSNAGEHVDHQEQNPSSDFVAGSNIFCSLNF